METTENTSRNWRRAPAVALLLLAAAACWERGPAGLGAAPPPGESPQLFAAAVGYFASRGEVPIRVDPRPLRPELVLYSVREGDFLPAADVVRMRTRVAEQGGWRLTDAVEEWTCVFAEGLPTPSSMGVQEPDSLRLHREACRQGGRRESLAFGLPQAGTDPAHPERWRIRAMRMLLHGFEVVDLYLERRPDGAWEVAEARVRSGVFS
jgi:hypothetical protein